MVMKALYRKAARPGFAVGLLKCQSGSEVREWQRIEFFAYSPPRDLGWSARLDTAREIVRATRAKSLNRIDSIFHSSGSATRHLRTRDHLRVDRVALAPVAQYGGGRLPHAAARSGKGIMLKGIGVSAGVAQGTAFVVSCGYRSAIPQRNIRPAELDGERRRFDSAVARAEAELRALQDGVRERIGCCGRWRRSASTWKRLSPRSSRITRGTSTRRRTPS